MDLNAQCLVFPQCFDCEILYQERKEELVDVRTCWEAWCLGWHESCRGKQHEVFHGTTIKESCLQNRHRHKGPYMIAMTPYATPFNYGLLTQFAS